MQIKKTNPSSILRNILLLGGAMVFLVGLTALFGNVKNFLRQENAGVESNLPAATLEFIGQPASLPQLLEFFAEHTIFFSVKDEASVNLTPEMRELLASRGSTQLPQLGLRHTYVGVVRDGKFVAESRSVADSVKLRFAKAEIISSGKEFGDRCELNLEGSTFEAEGRGLNAFVLNKNGSLLGIWNFDFFQEPNPRSRPIRSAPQFFENVDVFEIELKEKHFQKLKAKRDEAMEMKFLLASDEDFVPAKLRFQNEEFKAEVRLKGDWVDHLDGDNWSFRVKLDKSQALNGMRKFSLHRPATRNYAGEWLFHELLRDADILNLQYRFVQVRAKVTGPSGTFERNLGLYALEEFFDKHLIERGRRREGVIMKVDEDPIWEERAVALERGVDLIDLSYTSIATYENLPILPFGEKRVWQDSALLKQFNLGSKLYRDFLTGKRQLSEVFDVESVAKFNAICNLLGADHALAPHNYRVYLNPITSRLEPIGFDGNAWTKIWHFGQYHRGMDDLIFLEKYLAALEEVTSDAYFEKIKSWPGLDEQILLMSTAYPQFEHQWEILEHNRGTILDAIYPQRCLNVHFDKLEGNFIHLTIENFGRFPVVVLGIETGGRRFDKSAGERQILHPGRTSIALELDENYNRLFVRKGEKSAAFDLQEDVFRLKFSYKTLGTSKLRQEQILPWNANLAFDEAADPMKLEPNATEFDFLIFDEKMKTITCQPGLWQIQNVLIIPPGYTFHVGPDCRLELVGSAKIISFSPVKFDGSAASPIEIFSTTGNGQGLTVVNTTDTSLLRHVHFRGLVNPETDGWTLSGAVNFYRADVKLEQCIFSENHCEDALNIFRSHFSMEEVQFSNINADAFDGDYVTGKIRNCLFVRLGNDAIDVSGSEILVENVRIVNSGDKGLSAGEGSLLTARNLTISDGEIALASKDNSTLQISHSSLINNALAFTAFQKKPEFGPAKIEADSLTLTGNVKEFLIETNSSLLLDGQPMPTEGGVIERMYGEEFGRKSER